MDKIKPLIYYCAPYINTIYPEHVRYYFITLHLRKYFSEQIKYKLLKNEICFFLYPSTPIIIYSWSWSHLYGGMGHFRYSKYLLNTSNEFFSSRRHYIITLNNDGRS